MEHYLNKDSLAKLALENRLQQVVVKMACCRFVCSAQDADYLITTLESADKQNYCREVWIKH